MSTPRQPRQPRRTKKVAASTLPPTPLEQRIATLEAEQRKAPKTAYQKLSAKAQREHLEEAYLRSLVGMPEPVRQYTMLSGNRYKGDFCWPEPGIRLCVEVDGGAWLGAHGGHTSASGMERDRIRDAKCMLAGWTVLRVTATMIADQSAAYYTEQLYKMLAARRQQGVA
ncbi:MAG TPA: hypothetical protein VFN11_17170 [Ktedonobacterales bacterium]|nr:hypothetical protein [Ktedonobacterales bacterium]